MAINLKKGDSLQISLKNLIVGLGWRTNDGEEVDLDASAFMLAANGRIPKDEYFVFYNNLESPDHSVRSSGDDRSGGSNAGSDSDDESLYVNLEVINPQIKEIIFVVSIYEAKDRKQNFGSVHDAYMRIVDVDTNKELVRYQLEEDFSTVTIVEFGKLRKNGNAWNFEAMGEGYNKELDYLVNKYVV